MAVCKSCGATIKWLKTIRGKSMPVDAEPVELEDVDNGSLLVSRLGVTARVGEENKPDPNLEWYITHWATCPDGDQFRRK